MANQFRIRSALNDPCKGGKCAAGELDGHGESKEAEFFCQPPGKPLASVSVGCRELGKALGDISLVPGEQCPA